MLKFESEQRRRHNETMGDYSSEDGSDSTEHLSMSEKTLGLDSDYFHIFWVDVGLRTGHDLES